MSIKPKTMIEKEFLFPKLHADNFREVVTTVGGKMHEKDYVKETYVDAVIEREKGFPTGLSLGDYGIAIPHTDRGHVENSVIGVASLTNPIAVRSMIEPDKEITVNLVFLMAVKDPDGQVNMLKKLMSVFQDKELLQEIESVSDREEMYEILTKKGL